MCVCTCLGIGVGVFIFSTPFWGSLMQRGCANTVPSQVVVLSNIANAGKCDCSDLHPSISWERGVQQRKQGRQRINFSPSKL